MRGNVRANCRIGVVTRRSSNIITITTPYGGLARSTDNPGCRVSTPGTGALYVVGASILRGLESNPTRPSGCNADGGYRVVGRGSFSSSGTSPEEDELMYSANSPQNFNHAASKTVGILVCIFMLELLMEFTHLLFLVTIEGILMACKNL